MDGTVKKCFVQPSVWSTAFDGFGMLMEGTLKIQSGFFKEFFFCKKLITYGCSLDECMNLGFKAPKLCVARGIKRKAEGKGRHGGQVVLGNANGNSSGDNRASGRRDDNLGPANWAVGWQLSTRVNGKSVLPFIHLHSRAPAASSVILRSFSVILRSFPGSVLPQGTL